MLWYCVEALLSLCWYLFQALVIGGIIITIVAGFVILWHWDRIKTSLTETPPSFFGGWESPAGKLLASFGVDGMGIFLSALPLMGQVLGIFWGPVSSLIIYHLHGDSLMSGVACVEEMIPLPLVSSIPTATLAWLRQHWRIVVHYLFGSLYHREEVETIHAKKTT